MKHHLDPNAVLPDGAKADSTQANRPSRDTVMIVDDDECVIRVGVKMLERLGYPTLTAANGMDALTVYSRHADKVGVVLLDMAMPDMNGVECFHQLRELEPEIRVVLSSGFAESRLTQQLMEQGLFDRLDKPYRLQQLADVLARALHQA